MSEKLILKKVRCYNYPNKTKEIESYWNFLKTQPIYEYVNFVIDKVCDILCVDKDQLLSKYRGDYVTQARYYIVNILHENTDLGPDVMYVLKRHRTSFYHAEEKVEEFKTTYLQKKQWERCVNECSMSAFNRIKN